MLKLNVGLSRKVGEANYGSRGASVNLEIELESGLVSEHERFHERIRRLFGMARAAVEEELNQAGDHDGNDANGNRRQRPGQDHRANGRRATQSQVRAIHAVAEYHFNQVMAGSSAPDLDTLLGVYQDAWNAKDQETIQFGKGDDVDSLGRLAERMIVAFQQSDVARPEGAILGVERPVGDERLATLLGCLHQ
ncbi:MAG: hypothetical protein ACE5FA_08320, partial [Dehalococcoidia bacterium]